MLPGRPPVADWLHGQADWEPPETRVAWREEVSVIAGALIQTYPPTELLEDYPLKPHEQLRDRTDRVFEHLKHIAARAPNLPVWVVARGDEPQVLALAELAAGDTKTLQHATVILPPAAGGLAKTGLLDASLAWGDDTEHPPYDVADAWANTHEAPRRRLWSDANRPIGMRLVRRIDLPAEADAEDDDEPEMRSWFWYVQPRSADDDGSRVARRAQELDIHLKCTGEFANRLVDKLGLDPELGRAVVLAARWHDLGKNRRIWQRSIGNPNPENVLAKSGPSMRPLDITRYRHEFGSLLDVADEEEFAKLNSETKELVLHLIAAHHGRARPHFPAEEAFDPEPRRRDVQAVAAGVPQRFARLQTRYGRWGLAWLESLVRAADAMASNAILETDSGNFSAG
jgi:CRISPR-associated endonuclease/helicase Cas3